MRGNGAARTAAGAGSLAALAALTGGLPAVLYAAGGSPVPHAMPSWHQVLATLARPDDGTLFLAAVRWISWLAWAAFTICAAAEVLAQLRGRTAPRLRLAGPVQGLAAALVTSVIISLIPAPHLPRTAPSPVSASQIAATAPARPGTAALTTAGGVAASRAGGRGCVTRDPAGMPRRGRYVVVGEHADLWAIAAACLGDGQRWHDIFALNAGREQPGGQRLTDPDLIEPGWILRLPPPARHRAPAPSPAGRPPRPGLPGPVPRSAHPQHHGHTRFRPPAEPGISLPSGGLAGIGLATAVAAAAAVTAIQRRRRYRPGSTLTSNLDPAGPAAAPAIAALRRAAAARPPAGAGTPGEAGGAVRRDGTGRGPGSREPGPAMAAAGPRAAASAAAPAAPAPGAGLVTVGVRDGREAAVDVAALGGLGLTGPGALAAARAILAGLLTQPPPGPTPEVIVPAADAAALLPGTTGGGGLPGLIITPTLQAALDRAEAIIMRRARTSGDARNGGPGAGSSAVPVPAAVLVAAPARAASRRLAAILETGRSLGCTAILLGEWPHGVTGHVAADGTLTAATPATARLRGIRFYGLAGADASAVVSLLGEASGPAQTGRAAEGPAQAFRPVPAAPAGPVLPAPAAQDIPGPRGFPAAPPRPVRAAGTAPVPAAPARPADARPPAAGVPAAGLARAEILGPLRITAAGREIGGGLRKARELLAFLAANPGGATADAISEALWPGAPRGHGTSQRNLALRKLRQMLRDATGRPRPMFVTLTAGRYRLDPALITTDAADFQAALERARLAADPADRLAACRDAAALYRGPLADGAGYEWAEPYAETARRRALDAWTVIAGILEPGQPEQALDALETALGHDPYNEYLYCKIMRLQAAAGRPDAARRTLRLLETRLAELGVTPGPRTRQEAAALLGAGPAASGPGRPAAPAR